MEYVVRIGENQTLCVIIPVPINSKRLHEYTANVPTRYQGRTGSMVEASRASNNTPERKRVEGIIATCHAPTIVFTRGYARTQAAREHTRHQGHPTTLRNL